MMPCMYCAMRPGWFKDGPDLAKKLGLGPFQKGSPPPYCWDRRYWMADRCWPANRPLATADRRRPTTSQSKHRMASSLFAEPAVYGSLVHPKGVLMMIDDDDDDNNGMDDVFKSRCCTSE